MYPVGGTNIVAKPQKKKPKIINVKVFNREQEHFLSASARRAVQTVEQQQRQKQQQQQQ